MGVDEPEDESYEDDFYAQMETVEDGLEAWVGFPFVAELHADVGEGVAPRPGADKGVSVEAELGHFGDAGWEGDEGADDGEEACDENGEAAELLEVVFGEVEIVFAEEDVASEALDGGAATPSSEPVGGDGAEVAADGSGGGDPEEFELAGVHEEAREGHDDLGREGDAGGLDAHEEGYAEVASGRDDGDDEAGEQGDDFFRHEWSVYRVGV